MQDDVGGLLQSHAAGVDDQVVVAGVRPVGARVLVVVVAASLVHLVDAAGCRLVGEVLDGRYAADGVLAVGGDEDAEDQLLAPQHPVGAAAHDDAGLAPRQGADDAALGHEDGVVVGGVEGERDALVGEDQFPEFAVGDVLLVVADEVGRVAQSLGGLVDDVVVVEIHPQPQGQLLAQHRPPLPYSRAMVTTSGPSSALRSSRLSATASWRRSALGMKRRSSQAIWGSEDAHHEADVEHADQRARAHHLPVPMAEERGHEDDGDGHQGRVGTHLHLAEVFPHTLRDGQRQTLASQHQRVAAHLAGDAEGQQRAANQELGKLQGPAERVVEGGGNLQETRQPHRQVGVEAEEEGDENLRSWRSS